MKKTVYYQTLYRRDNPIKNFITSTFYDLCSIPRMILEVGIRNSFGRRYFSFTLSLIVFLLLLIPPIAIARLRSGYFKPQLSDILFENLTWYLFTALYLVFCLKRRGDRKATSAAEFDFKHFSYSSGFHLPFFYRFKFLGRELSLRTIETVVEPLCFAIAGIVLIAFGQLVGWLILFCAICYSISYCSAYWQGDDIMLDYIDERIVNEGLFNTFVEGDDYTTHDGFRHRGPRPADREFRKNLFDDMTGGYDEPAAAI